jgi:cell division protein FtsB
MDNTGETGESVEPVEPADSGDDIEIVAEVEPDEVEDEVEDDEVEDEVEHEVELDAAAMVDEPDEVRERHPSGAAALAKRVAMDRPTRIGVASLVFVALMFVFVFPTRSYLAQQRQVHDARHSVEVLREQNARLAREAQRLQTPAEIERLARSQFNMVFDGEQAYNVVPPTGTATTTTTSP